MLSLSLLPQVISTPPAFVAPGCFDDVCVGVVKDRLLHGLTGSRPRGPMAKGALKPERYHFNIVSTKLYLYLNGAQKPCNIGYIM